MVGESVGFGSELAGTEVNHKVEGREVFGPVGLSVHKHFHHGKVFKVLVISDDVDAMLGSLKVMMPDFEAFEDGKEFFVVGVIVALSIGEGAGVESDQVDFSIRSQGGDDTCKGVVGSVSLN